MHPAPDEVRRQLERILASEPFANSERLSRFLRYVVERALAGEADRLKEYVIGTEVFDRGDQYDPRIDSIVRVEAGRLRTKLEEYYGRHGAADAVIVRLPRGGYAPVFERRDPAPVEHRPATSARPVMARAFLLAAAAVVLLTGAAAWRLRPWLAADAATPAIRIAVLPFRSYSPDEAAGRLAARLTDGVTGELARLGTLGVVSHTSARQFAGTTRPLKEIARSLQADIVMEASLDVTGDRLDIQARLVDATLDRKVWVGEFTASRDDVREVQRRIAADTAAAVARLRR